MTANILNSRLRDTYFSFSASKGAAHARLLGKDLLRIDCGEERRFHGLKVALLVNEFFGAAGTAKGGYGFLARHFVAKHLPAEDLELDVLLGIGEHRFAEERYEAENVSLYRLPWEPKFRRRWLRRKQYDAYLSIEFEYSKILDYEERDDVPLLVWVQDPRPWSEWREINTVQLHREYCYYNQRDYDLVHEWYRQGRVQFATQASFLTPKAIDLYRLPNEVDMPRIANPVEQDDSFDVMRHPKKNSIIFLGRLDSVKRGWIFCEIARLLPDYEFHVLGSAGVNDHARSASLLESYRGGRVPNLFFHGHVEGEQKQSLLRDAKVLVNTSIHEALPVSFLEALSCGVLIVSNRNPDSLAARFGVWVGEVLGDGIESAPRFASAICTLLSDEATRRKLSEEAVAYVRRQHDVAQSSSALRSALFAAAARRVSSPVVAG